MVVTIPGNDSHVVMANADGLKVASYDLKSREFLATRRMRWKTRFPRSPLGNHDDDDDDDDERYEEEEEENRVGFFVSGLAISGDGDHVICANSVDNNLYFLHIRSLLTAKVVKGQWVS